MYQQTIMGIDIVVSPDRLRYTLPAELLPGLPWPPGFREDFDAWAAGFFSQIINMVPDGEAFMIRNRCVMNPRTYAAFKKKIPNVTQKKPIGF